MKNLFCVLAVALASVGGSAGAATYTFDRAVGDGLVSGYLETDDTIGVLTAANFIDWSVAISGPNYSTSTLQTMTALNSSLEVAGSLLTATATDIYFDFASSSLGYFFVNVYPSFGPTSGARWCFVNFDAPCAVPGDEHGESALENGPGNDPNPFEYQYYETAVVVASVVSPSPVPVPASLPLLLAGMVGLGWVGRKRTNAFKSPRPSDSECLSA